MHPSTGHRDGDGKGTGVDFDIVASREIRDTRDGWRSGVGGKWKELTDLVVMLMDQHKETGEVGAGADGLPDGGLGVLEVDLDDPFGETFAKGASSDLVGKITAEGRLVGRGRVFRRRSGGALGVGGHGGG